LALDLAFAKGMKYGIGQELILLRMYRDAAEGFQRRPVARATVVDFNGNTQLYKVKYVEYGSGNEGVANVPEELLVAPFGAGPTAR
jgi:hypothetical protein